MRVPRLVGLSIAPLRERKPSIRPTCSAPVIWRRWPMATGGGMTPPWVNRRAYPSLRQSPVHFEAIISRILSMLCVVHLVSRQSE